MSTKHSIIIVGILSFICLTLLPSKSYATPQEDLVNAGNALAAANEEHIKETDIFNNLTKALATEKVLLATAIEEDDKTKIDKQKSTIASLNTAIQTSTENFRAINARISAADQKFTAAKDAGAVWVDTPLQNGGKIIPGQSSPGDLTEKNITDFLTWVAEKAITFVLVIAAIFIMLAGYIYITSLGNTTKVEQAKQMLLYTLIGVLVVMGAYLVVNTILSQVATVPKTNPTLIAPTPSLTPAQTP